MNELESRKREALESIKSAFGTKEDEYGATLFVSHHLEELDSDYWVKHLGAAKPEPKEILNLLQFQSQDNGLVFDFSLPEEVTNYVVSVSFDETGNVEDISMES